MSSPNIEKVREQRELPVFAEFDRVVEQIRDRAQEIFQRHAQGSDTALDDWLQAEREICWPAAELKESDKEFHATVALPGFKSKDVEVTAMPTKLIVKAAARIEKSEADKQGSPTIRWSEFHSEDVFRRIDLPSAIDVDKVSADFSDGLLTVKAQKAKDGQTASRKVDLESDS